MDSIADGSPRQLTRIAGGLYLINILGGAYAIPVVPAMLVVGHLLPHHLRRARRQNQAERS